MTYLFPGKSDKWYTTYKGIGSLNGNIINTGSVAVNVIGAGLMLTGASVAGVGIYKAMKRKSDSGKIKSSIAPLSVGIATMIVGKILFGMRY